MELYLHSLICLHGMHSNNCTFTWRCRKKTCMINSLLVCLKMLHFPLQHVPLWSHHHSVHTNVASDIHMVTFSSVKRTESVCTEQRRLEGNSEWGALSIIIPTILEISFCSLCNSLMNVACVGRTWSSCWTWHWGAWATGSDLVRRAIKFCMCISNLRMKWKLPKVFSTIRISWATHCMQRYVDTVFRMVRICRLKIWLLVQSSYCHVIITGYVATCEHDRDKSTYCAGIRILSLSSIKETLKYTLLFESADKFLMFINNS